jgi:hypothetical protein
MSYVLLLARVLACVAALAAAPSHAAEEPPKPSVVVERALAEAPEACCRNALRSTPSIAPSTSAASRETRSTGSHPMASCSGSRGARTMRFSALRSTPAHDGYPPCRRAH